MTAKQPRRFFQRVTGVPRRVGRAIEGQVDSDRTLGDTMEVVGGRTEVRIAPGESGLVQTRRGLAIAPGVIGERNRAQMSHIVDLSSSAVLTDVVSKVNELLSELRRTKRLKGM